MDNWQKEWEKILNTLGTEVEHLFEDLSQGVNDAADAFIQFSEEVADQINDALTPGLDEFNQEVEGWVDPFLQIIAQIEASFSDAVSPISHTVDPVINQHPTCVGCQHYHGQEYNGVMFVCAMHPYGWEEEKCPDWESTWKDPR